MNNEEKILDLLNSISSSIEELKQEIKRIDIKIDMILENRQSA